MEKLQNTRDLILQDIRNILAREGNGRTCVGSAVVTIATTAGGTRLTGIPATAQSAEITLDPGAGTTTNVSASIRYTLDGTAPTATASGAGVPMGDYDTIEILGNTNLNAFLGIACDSATVKYLKVLYFA